MLPQLIYTLPFSSLHLCDMLQFPCHQSSNYVIADWISSCEIMDPVLQFWRSTGGYYAKQTQARSYNLWPAKNLLEQLSCGILMVVLSMLGNNNKIHLPSSLSSNQGDRPNQSLASCRSGVLQTIMQISRWIWSTSMMLEMIPKWEKRLCTPPVVQLRLHGNLLARAGLGKMFSF